MDVSYYARREITEWARNIQNVCGDFEASFNKQSSLFIGEVKSFLLGDTEIAFIKSNASYIRRQKGIPDRVKDRFCFLVLQYTGKMQIKYKEHYISMNEGDIVLLDPEETIEMYPRGLFSHISVHLSRDKLFKNGITVDYFSQLITSNMSGYLLKGMLQSLSPEHIELWYSKEDGNAFEDALIALIKPTINYKSLAVIDQLKVKAERFILEHLNQPNLNSQIVANYLGISLRHLYRLFEKDSQSVHKYIQLKRLEKIQYELKDCKNKEISITEIAMKWGFGDSAHFSKIFKKNYGISPKVFRETRLA